MLAKSFIQRNLLHTIFKKLPSRLKHVNHFSFTSKKDIDATKQEKESDFFVLDSQYTLQDQETEARAYRNNPTLSKTPHNSADPSTSHLSSCPLY